MKQGLSLSTGKEFIMVRYILFTAYFLGIMEMIFIAIVLLDISIPSPKNISNTPSAGSTEQHVSLMKKDLHASPSETVLWFTRKDNNP